MIEGKHVHKDMFVEWNQNTVITARPLDIPVVQVPMTMALMPHQPVIYNMGNWIMMTSSKPRFILISCSQGENKEHNMMGCVKLEHVMNLTIEGKRYYVRSIEDGGTIKITGVIFYIDLLKLI